MSHVFAPRDPERLADHLIEEAEKTKYVEDEATLADAAVKSMRGKLSIVDMVEAYRIVKTSKPRGKHRIYVFDEISAWATEGKGRLDWLEMAVYEYLKIPWVGPDTGSYEIIFFDAIWDLLILSAQGCDSGFVQVERQTKRAIGWGLTESQAFLDAWGIRSSDYTPLREDLEPYKSTPALRRDMYKHVVVDVSTRDGVAVPTIHEME